jgi:Carboxypeptidase regulatory-like domain/TonB-dependent Receptor Plug Domain
VEAIIMKRIASLPVLLALLLSSAGNARPQVTTATVYGTVTDPTGASIPGATVNLTQQETSAVSSKVTTETGEFQFDFLRVGTYTLTIEAKGFKRHQSTGFPLVAGQNVRQTYSLQVGETSETVQVEGVAPLVNTVSSEQLQSFGARTVTDLPLARRNFSSILSIGTGVTTGGGGSGQGIRLNGVGRNGTGFSVDGTESSANPEGRSTQTFGAGNYVDILSLESIEEVHTVKGVLPAEYSGALGGQINVLTRSGTNAFHGSLFENFQAENLNARDPFLPRKPAFTYNQFGGAAGGPIKRDRIFLFGAYEGYREARFTRVEGDVPTQSMRDTVIRAVPAYAEPLRYVPLPNQTHNPAGNVGLFVDAAVERRRDNHIDLKGDLRLTDTSNLALTYSHGRPFRLTPRLFLNGSNNQDLQVFSERGTVSFVTGGSSWSSETRYGYNMNDIDRLDGIIGLPGPREDTTFGRRLGRLNTNLGWSTAGGEVVILEGPTWNLGEKFSKHIGQHSLKFGGLYTHQCCQRNNVENVVWLYTGLEDLLANIPSQINASFGNGEYTATMWQMGFFLQDDWRVHSRLTLNLGMRYDYFGHMVAHPDDQAGSFLVNPDGLLNSSFSVGPIRPEDNPYESDKWNFGPRFGFAYNVDGKGKTVIRGGTGFIFTPFTMGSLWQSVGTRYVPKRILFTRQEAIQNNLKYPMYNDDLAKVVTQQAIAEGFTNIFAAVRPQIQNPYAHHFTLGIQRELSSSLVLETAFVGVRGTKFILYRPMNEPNRATGIRPNPKLRSTLYADESQTSNYVSWQTSLRKRYSRNLSGSLHYTWGKSLAYNGGDPGAYYQGDNDARTQDFFNIRAEYGPAVGDTTHVLNGEWVYELPKLSSLSNAVVRNILGDWQMGGIFTARSGEPLGITQTSSLYHARPDYVGGQTVLDNYSETRQYLNLAAFARVPLSAASGALVRPGNLGWGAVRGPGMWNVDLSLGKNFSLTERVRLQVRSDMLNVLNHFNPSGITTSINSGTFGQVRSTLSTRVIQLNGRVSW